jgi:vesicle coat complex subunit
MSGELGDDKSVMGCSLIIVNDVENAPSASELENIFRKGKIEEKIDALKTLIKLIIHDQNYPKMVMTILQYVATSPDHQLKKLLFLYWEVSLLFSFFIMQINFC